jgi:uncharacterized RDD family membrane protein YckC
MAAGVFAITFAAVAQEAPHSRLTTLCALAVTATLWVLFQYLFLNYARTTPGMVLAQLELSTLEGKKPSMFACRSRAVASALSGFSMGLGYAWALVDEDRLGWHDRISQTHLREIGGIGDIE